MMRSAYPRLTGLLCLLMYSMGSFASDLISQSSAEDNSQPEFQIIGFGDMSYVSSDAARPDGFAIGQGVAHLIGSLGDSLSFFSEVSATAKDSNYAFEVERFILKYDFSDALKLSAGRYHTPIGYWNSSFHHGAWLQSTVSRPEMVKFGSKIVPIHFVGVLLEGSVPSSRLGFEYKAGFGNGRHDNIARAGDAGDTNQNKAWVLQFNSRPHDLYGLNLGLGFYSDEVALVDSPSVKENIASAYVAWSKETPEVIVEYQHSSHELVNDSSVSGDVDAWYAQLAYRLPLDDNKWKPYARLEQTRVDESDPLLGAEGLDYDGAILGVRWDFHHYAALKAEYRNEEFNNLGRESGFRLQIAFVLTKM